MSNLSLVGFLMLITMITYNVFAWRRLYQLLVINRHIALLLARWQPLAINLHRCMLGSVVWTSGETLVICGILTHKTEK